MTERERDKEKERETDREKKREREWERERERDSMMERREGSVRRPIPLSVICVECISALAYPSFSPHHRNYHMIDSSALTHIDTHTHIPLFVQTICQSVSSSVR